MKFGGALTLSAFFFVCNAQRIYLGGQWNGYILSPNNSLHLLNESVGSFAATVPGGVYSDLVRAGIIPENLAGDNDVNNRWVSNYSFAFNKSFQVNETFLQARNVALTFHGLDTFASIFVNDNLIGETSNMFVRYRYNVKEHLKLGANELKVVIVSPVRKASELYNEQSSSYVVPPECVPEVYNGECHVNHIRKMQASFSWDWGPAFPSMGIWKDVTLEAIDELLLTDVTTDLYRKNNTWEIVFTAFYSTVAHEESSGTVSGELIASIVVNDNVTIQNTSVITISLGGQSTNASIVLTIHDDNVDRWWPNGYGSQKLYDASIAMKLRDKRVSRDFRVGFRTVELVQEPLMRGLSFYFKVNDVPIFAKGSNWIPSSVFPELSAKKETVDHLLTSAKRAHMNMLRVWGGGLYESDLFYDLADEYGIMIWQDFMFACGMYPTSKEFLESIREEVRQNVKRLQHHSSVVIWAGNNENEAALYGNWYGTGNKTIYAEDYVKLYVDVIKTEVERLDPTTPFVVSSPSDGLFTDENNYLGPNPYSNLYGDVHYYNYVLDGWNINQYPRTRFASEYGVQSIPSMATLETAIISRDDLKLNSPFMKHRQHLLGGYESMENLVSKNFDIPKTNDATNDLIDYIYLSQVNQAVAIKVETESYRQARSGLNSLGEGKTMGALYWQLNDVWQAPSWSSIEFGGRWKMLHYYAVEFFAPVIITPHVSAANELELYVVSDQLTTIRNCSFVINTYKWHSLVPIHTQSFKGVTIPSNAARMVASFWLDDYLQHAGCGGWSSMKKKCVIEFELRDKNGERIAPYNYVYPAPLKSVPLTSVNITVKVNRLSLNSEGSDYTIELKSRGISLFVWLDFGSDFLIEGQFSENGFHMFHGVKTIVFRSKKTTTPEMIEACLRVTTLSDLRNPDRRTPRNATAEGNR